MPTTLSSFFLFTNLAAELRFKIWNFACESRVVELRYNTDQDRCVSGTRAPAILQACQESRNEALRTYKLSFGTRSNPAKIYFNQFCDTLYLPRHRKMGYDETLRDFRSFLVGQDILDGVKWLALDHVDVEVKRPWESYNKAALLRGFPRLEQVILVLCPGPGCAEELEFAEPRQDPETILRIWVDFRQSFVKEQRMLEEVSKEVGKDCPSWSLPTVRIKSKAVQRQIDNSSS